MLRVGTGPNKIGVLKKRDTETENNYVIMEPEAGVMAVTSQGVPRFACKFLS